LCPEACGWLDCVALSAALEGSRLEEFELRLRQLSTVPWERLHGLKIAKDEDIQFNPVQGQLTLRDLRDLWRLDVPVAALLGWSPEQAQPLAETLPAALTHLCVSEDLPRNLSNPYPWTEEFILAQLEAFFATQPQLQVFELIPHSSRWDATAEGRLYDICEAAGIACFIHSQFPFLRYAYECVCCINET
jgi:hypothetical protein